MVAANNKEYFASLGKIIDIITLVIAILMVLYPFFFLSELPERIPTLININGEIDGYGAKGFFLVLPMIGFMSYVGLSVLQRKPHVFNYPIKVTEKNAQDLYSLGIEMIRFVKTILVILFAYVTYVFVKLATGIQIKYSSFMIIGGCLIMVIGVIMYIIKMKKLCEMESE